MAWCNPCAPSCAVPSCAFTPVIGLGSCGIGGFGYGGFGGYGGGYGVGFAGYGSGIPTSASSLGILAGANVGCISQTPPAEVTIQPPPVVVTVPGAILSATSQPVSVGGYSPCASGAGGYFGGGGSLGGGYLGGFRGRRRYGICGPC